MHILGTVTFLEDGDHGKRVKKKFLHIFGNIQGWVLNGWVFKYLEGITIHFIVLKNYIYL